MNRRQPIEIRGEALSFVGQVYGPWQAGTVGPRGPETDPVERAGDSPHGVQSRW
jgi:hypothetical protein